MTVTETVVSGAAGAPIRPVASAVRHTARAFLTGTLLATSGGMIAAGALALVLRVKGWRRVLFRPADLPIALCAAYAACSAASRVVELGRGTKDFRVRLDALVQAAALYIAIVALRQARDALDLWSERLLRSLGAEPMHGRALPPALPDAGHSFAEAVATATALDVAFLALSLGTPTKVARCGQVVSRAAPKAGFGHRLSEAAFGHLVAATFLFTYFAVGWDPRLPGAGRSGANNAFDPRLLNDGPADNN